MSNGINNQTKSYGINNQTESYVIIYGRYIDYEIYKVIIMDLLDRYDNHTINEIVEEEQIDL
jgi:hypothetical protein